MLCAGHHDAIDNGVRYEGLRIADRVHDCIEWGHNQEPRKMYEIYDRESGDILRAILLEELDTEGGDQTNLVNDEGDALAGTSTPPSVPGTSE